MKLVSAAACSALMLSSCSDTWMDKMWESNVQHENQIKDNAERIAALESQCQKLNSDIQALAQLYAAIDANDRITSVTELTEDGKHIGYRLSFLKNSAVEVIDGKDVTDCPQIGVARCPDGYIAWTVNGSFLIDEDGNPIMAIGKDAVVPQFKIVNGEWFISYDGITLIKLGTRNGKDADTMFADIDIESDPDNVIFTMSDGSSFSIKWYKEMSIVIDSEGDETGIEARREITLSYRVENPGPNTLVTAASDGNYKVRLVQDDAVSGKIVVTGPKQYEDGHFTLIAADSNGCVKYRVVNFYEREMVLENGDQYSISAKGGSITVPVSANFDYRLVLPENVDWLEIEAETKAEMRETNFNLKVDPNRSVERRTTSVDIYAQNDPFKPLRTIQINQEGAVWNIDRTKYTVRSEGKTIETYMASTFGIEMISDVSWLSIKSESSDDVNYRVIFTIEPNMSSSARSTVVTLWDSSKTVKEGEIEFVQVAAGEENPDDMIFVVRAYPVNGYTVTLPLYNGLSGLIDWGDGSEPENITRNASHTYPEEIKEYTVRISGIVMGLSSIDIRIPSITKVVQWGHTELISLDNAFRNNSLLEEIPGDSDESFKDVTSFNNAFYNCISLKSIPDNLFAYAMKAKQMCETFNNCRSITVIPNGLLSNCNNLEHINSIFCNCKGISEIPPELFWECRELKDFNSVFAGCNRIRTIPEGLLKNCNKITAFSSTFEDCSSLTMIPFDLFSYCPEMNYMWQTFCGCDSLTSLPSDLFDNNRKLSYMQEVFFFCVMTGETPYTVIDGQKVHLYERVNYPDEFVTFTNQYTYNRSFTGNNFTDNENIPLNWKY